MSKAVKIYSFAHCTMIYFWKMTIIIITSSIAQARTAKCAAERVENFLCRQFLDSQSVDSGGMCNAGERRVNTTKNNPFAVFYHDMWYTQYHMRKTWSSRVDKRHLIGWQWMAEWAKLHGWCACVLWRQQLRASNHLSESRFLLFFFRSTDCASSTDCVYNNINNESGIYEMHVDTVCFSSSSSRRLTALSPHLTHRNLTPKCIW